MTFIAQCTKASTWVTGQRIRELRYFERQRKSHSEPGTQGGLGYKQSFSRLLKVRKGRQLSSGDSRDRHYCLLLTDLENHAYLMF